MQPMLALFGERLREARRESSLKIEELCEKIGVSRQSLLAWETGKNRVELEKIPKLAKALEKPIGWFFGELPEDLDDPFYRPNENDQERERRKNIDWMKAGYPAPEPVSEAEVVQKLSAQLERAEKRAEERHREMLERHQEMLAALQALAGKPSIEDEKAAALKRIRTTMAGTPTVDPSARPKAFIPESGAARTKKDLPKKKND